MRNIIIKIRLYNRILGFIRVTTGSAVVPVPAAGADDRLPVRELRAVDYGSTSGFDDSEEIEELRELAGGSVLPETKPGEPKFGAFQSLFVGEEL